jgi:ATP-binding cassette subfamily B protein
MLALKKLFIYLKPYWLATLLAPLFMILEVAMDLMQPRLTQAIIDEGISRSNIHLVVHYGVLMVICSIIGLIGGMGCGIFAIRASLGFGTDLRKVAFAKVQSLSFGNLDKLETGALVTRLTNDITQVQDVAQMILRMMVRSPLLLAGSFILAILTSPTMALIFFGLVPLVSLIVILVMKLIIPLFSEVQKRLDRLNSVLQENLAGIRVVKAFARADNEIERFGVANDSLMSINIKAARFGALTMPLMMFVLNVGVVAALWIGGYKVVEGQLQVGQIIAFINYLLQTMMNLMMVSMLIMGLSRAGASAVRIQEVLDDEPKVKNNPGAMILEEPRGEIRFENVSFRYDDDEADLVLKDLNFTIEPGQTVAILGATGSGKSSLVNLIPRFYDVTQGQILLDGVDVREIDEGSLRRTVSIALQESVLFSGTIRENIAYGNPEASDDDVLKAAQVAQADKFIREMPEGYDAVVGQRGVNLSGGQKQRIAIARAILPDPIVLILDDSTSAVDVRTESKIHDSFVEYRKGRTCLIVAQRISTVIKADKILVIDDGQLVAEGPHEQLIESSPIYREIFESQKTHGEVMAVAE